MTRARRVIGWIPVGVSTAIASLWGFWGAIENFHEGWFYRSLLRSHGRDAPERLLKLSESLAWAVFLGAGPILWAFGVCLFLRSGLTRPKKIAWTVFLAILGAEIGWLLPLPAIRNRFLLLLVALPLLAFLDVRLSRSSRTFSFWLRACAFEICTVFGSAALTRLGLDLIRRAP